MYDPDSALYDVETYDHDPKLEAELLGYALAGLADSSLQEWIREEEEEGKIPTLGEISAHLREEIGDIAAKLHIRELDKRPPARLPAIAGK